MISKRKLFVVSLILLLVELLLLGIYWISPWPSTIFNEAFQQVVQIMFGFTVFLLFLLIVVRDPELQSADSSF